MSPTTVRSAARQLRDVGRRIDGVLSDVHAMRQIVERMDERVGRLQLQVDSFSTRIGQVESVVQTVADDVKKGTDRLPDPNDGTIHKLRSALSSTPDDAEP